MKKYAYKVTYQVDPGSWHPGGSVHPETCEKIVFAKDMEDILWKIQFGDEKDRILGAADVISVHKLEAKVVVKEFDEHGNYLGDQDFYTGSIGTIVDSYGDTYWVQFDDNFTKQYRGNRLKFHYEPVAV